MIHKCRFVGAKQISPLLIFGLIICAVACGKTVEDVLPPDNVDVTPAPDFTLPTLSGDTATLSEQQGQWILVNFWATWCAPCVEEMPYLQEISDEGEMLVWGINMRETVPEIETFMDEHNLSFPILLSPDDNTILAYRGNLPRSYMIAPDGSIAHVFYGPLNPTQFKQWVSENMDV